MTQIIPCSEFPSGSLVTLRGCVGSEASSSHSSVAGRGARRPTRQHIGVEIRQRLVVRRDDAYQYWLTCRGILVCEPMFGLVAVLIIAPGDG